MWWLLRESRTRRGVQYSFPVQLNTKVGHYEANLVPSVYGKNEFRRMVRTASDEGSIRYIKMNRRFPRV